MQTEKNEMSGIYSIPLTGLKEGKHTYEFVIGDDFFNAFEGSEIRRGELKADVVLEKCSTHIEIQIALSGRVEVTCDRCLDRFYMPVSSENRLYVRQGKEWDDNDPDMIAMPLDEHEIDLSQFLYEYIHLALPIKRIHPDDDKGRSTCNTDMIRKLKDHLVAGDTGTDPRWEELRKLTRNN